MPGAAAISSLLLLAVVHLTMAATTIEQLFPDSKTNLTTIKWAHRVNSQDDLNKALESSDIRMLEGDVIIGKLNNQSNGTDTVIMGHPPNTTSDLSLEEFLKKVTPDKKKGIKLDFKTIEVYEMGLTLIQKSGNLTIPLWLNADILKGPVNATDDPLPVDAKRFFAGAAKLPQALLSIGWTTRLEPSVQEGSYTAEQINEMVKHVEESKTNQSVTYPVRACYAANDVNVLKTLLTSTNKANNPTLTIWSSEGDKVDAAKLSQLIKTIGVNKVYVDVPATLWKQLDLSSSAFTARSSLPLLLASVVACIFTVKLL